MFSSKSSGTLYGMVTTAKSNNFTPWAINSFLANTALGTNDLVVLIDNDQCWNNDSYSTVQIIKNSEPKSFAANINQLIKIADQFNLDLVMMNNDIILTPGWNTELEKRNDIICLPSCNQTHIYFNSENIPIFEQNLNLNEYNGRWRELYGIARQHTTNSVECYERLRISFYLFRLPCKIYRVVGLFDEDFNPAGGEDVDYRIRAAQKGFKTMFTNGSYVLHFHGKSTWHGSETEKETSDRNTAYFQKFISKWGEDLAYLLLQAGQSIDTTIEIAKRYNITNEELENFDKILKKVIGVNLDQKSAVSLDQVSAPGLLPYIENLGNNIVGCELGVCLGLTLRYFLDMSNKIDKVYAIDAYEPYMDHWGQVTQEMVDRWRSSALKLLDPYTDKIEFLQMDSFYAADAISNNSLDYIFIDGDHSYAAVARDLRKYFGKVKTGGIFAGHDWNLPPVKAAVEHFRKDRDINSEIRFTEKNVWFWYKE